MATPSERRRAYGGPVLFSHGFRVFFLLAGLWAVFSMTLWILSLSSGLSVPSRFGPVAWHMHEMLFGYTYAALAGFLLTAVPNWTGRLPVIGWPTAGLAGLWVLARIVALFSAHVSPLAAVVAELVFPSVLIAILAREIIAGKNWRNLVVLALVTIFTLGDGAFLAETILGFDLQGLGARLATGAIVLLITVIGGRVVPSFTRNWLARQGGGVLPVAPNQLDKAVVGASALVLLIWVLVPDWPGVGILAGLAGLSHLGRMARWGGWRAGREPLVWVLHAAYLFVAIGFFMLALGYAGVGTAAMGAVPHGWTAGAVACMTLAMMTRASLGHSGRMLHATRSVTLIYLFAIGAGGARILSTYTGNAPKLLDLAGGFWIIAFLMFVIVFFPILAKPRKNTA